MFLGILEPQTQYIIVETAAMVPCDRSFTSKNNSIQVCNHITRDLWEKVKYEKEEKKCNVCS